MVICVADDPGMHSSQNEQDSRHYAVSAKLPMLEPADSEEARAFAKRAFQLSEEYDTPVFLKLCTRIAHSQSIVELGEREEVPAKPYEKNIAKYVMVPGNARPRHPIGEERTQRLDRLRGDHRPEPGGAGNRPYPGHHHFLHLLPICPGGVWSPCLDPEAGPGQPAAPGENPGVRGQGVRCWC